MTNWRWSPPERHASLGSTNTEALADPRPGRVVVADHQSAGQGRRGRSWTSPPGTGMAISAVVPALSPELVGWLPLATGLAVARALDASPWTVPTTLKWPNDVLVEVGHRPGKLCGILCQVAENGAVVVGTGLNVDHDIDELPVPTATSWRLARGGAPLPDGARETYLTAYLDTLAELHDALAAGDPRTVADAYAARCATIGREVTVHLPDGTERVGTATGVDDDGALVVEGGGRRTVHHAGDVEHLRPR